MDASWLYELEKYAIVIVGLVMAYTEFAQYFRHRKSWIKLALGSMGLYWAAYYAYSILRVLLDLRMPAHQVFVRSGILLTVALVGGNALMTLKLMDRLDR